MTEETPATPIDPAAPPPAAAPDPAPAEPSTLGSDPGNNPAVITGTEPDIDPTWPDDWRDRFIKKAKVEERDKLSKRLSRFSSPDNVLSSYLELERKISTGALKATLAEGAAEPEVAAYRKAWGIPETPDGYGIAPPQGVELSEPDKADLSGFLADMHAANAPAPVVQMAVAKFFEMQQRAEQQLYEAAQENTFNQRVELKTEYGRDFDRNVRLAQADLVNMIGSEKAEELVSRTLANGTKLGDDPDFIRFVVGQALAKADDSALVTSDITASGKTLQDAYNEALDLVATDSSKYHSPEHQAKLKQLGSAMARQREKRAA